MLVCVFLAKNASNFANVNEPFSIRFVENEPVQVLARIVKNKNPNFYV
jgi:hypothetical protein